MTNDELFLSHRLLIEHAFMSAIQSGLVFSEVVAVILDEKSEGLPPALLNAFELEENDSATDMPIPGGTKAATPLLALGLLDRDTLIDLLTESDPDMAHALAAKPTLERAPCLLLANAEATLYRLPIPVLTWAEGGDA